jgi:hypothetical protein
MRPIFTLLLFFWTGCKLCSHWLQEVVIGFVPLVHSDHRWLGNAVRVPIGDRTRCNILDVSYVFVDLLGPVLEALSRAKYCNGKKKFSFSALTNAAEYGPPASGDCASP